MNFQDAEKIFQDLKQQHAAGKLSDEDFEARVANLWCQDAQGHWWLLGVETGEWYMHDGQKWIKATPPTPIVPAVPPPAVSGSAVESGAAQKSTRGGALPARRQRGASPMMLGIIAGVALIAILILVGACFIISGMLGNSAIARATTTPTSSLALLPTLTEIVPTDTPLPQPTVEVTATEEVTPTRAAAKPTATKKPAPAGPTATATLNIPPGVYATNIETVPAIANIGDTIGFKVSFLNTTGSIQTFNWFVKVYQCPEECGDFKHSHGETLLTNSNVAPGTSTLSTSQNIDLKAGIRCDLIAIANYVDPVNQLPTPFQATQDNGRFSFTACR